MLQWHPGVAVYVVSALAAAVTCVAAWRRRGRAPAAVWLVANMAGLTYWALCVGVGTLLSSTAGQVAASLAVYPSVGVVVGSIYCLVHAVADREWTPRRRTVVLLAVEPVVMGCLAATNPWHHLLPPTPRRCSPRPTVLCTRPNGRAGTACGSPPCRARPASGSDRRRRDARRSPFGKTSSGCPATATTSPKRC